MRILHSRRPATVDLPRENGCSSRAGKAAGQKRPSGAPCPVFLAAQSGSFRARETFLYSLSLRNLRGMLKSGTANANCDVRWRVLVIYRRDGVSHYLLDRVTEDVKRRGARPALVVRVQL